MDDLYRVLEVEPDTPQEQLEKVYRALVRRYHPDGHPPARRAWAEERMKQINGAWAILGDAHKRARYDRERRPAAAPGSAAGVGAPTVEARPAAEAAPRREDECAAHPGRTRTSVCLHCRRNVCEECVTTHQGLPYCHECAPTGSARPRVRSRPGTPRRSLARERADARLFQAISALLGVATLGPYLYSVIGVGFIRDAGSQLLCLLGSGVLAAFCLYVVLLSAGDPFGRWFSRARPPQLVAFFLGLLLVEVGGLAALAVALPRIEKNVAAAVVADRIARDRETASRALAAFYGSWLPRKSPLRKGLDWIESGGDPEPSRPIGHGNVKFEGLTPEGEDRALAAAETYLKTEKSREAAARNDRAACLAYLVWCADVRGGPPRRAEAEACLKLQPRPYFAELCRKYLAPPLPPAVKPASPEPPPPKRREPEASGTPPSAPPPAVAPGPAPDGP